MQVAWEARGNGAAATVTEDGWLVFQERLRDAREALIAASDADPDGYTAPTVMLSVCMGMGLDREEMEYTFRQAMAANPDNRQACATKLEYLHPKWLGSRDGNDYLTFAWALALHPGDGRMGETVLANLIFNNPISGLRFEAARVAMTGYYMRPAVWGVVRAAADRALEADPDDRIPLNQMARIAFLSNRLDTAREYFVRLGEDFSPAVFADRAEYDRIRREAGVPGAPR
ncbi:MAG TPA: hypothetical protein VH092_12530 [Urbifossiella sp.]|nr:hypothetical protein [Urbifossiella sp.]